MFLCIESLDDLEQMVLKKFSEIQNKDVQIPRPEGVQAGRRC